MTSANKLKNYLEQLCPLPPEDWELFRSKLQYQVFAKKEKILQAGKIENYVSFIERGIVRYFVEEGEKQTTFEIAFENSFATGYDSFLTRQPVLYHGEALAETALWRIHYTDLQEVYAATQVGNKIGRITGEQLYIRKNKRQLSLLKDTAEQRYIGLLKEHVHFLEQVPLKYLASYIGITPQALSRIRRRIAG
jgi:CRP-like cAMP-binding protein